MNARRLMVRPRPRMRSNHGRRSSRVLVLLTLLLGLSNLFLTAAAASPPPEAAFEECTIAVLSGRATADGRPLLWKNRDSAQIDNEVVFFDDSPYRCHYRYLALVGAGETAKAWMGVNETGFAVLNSVSFNLPDTCTWGISNGELMKKALQICATVEEFQDLLVTTNAGGRATPTNLAVLDAQGGAALFEAGNFSFVRFDAADSAACPTGFVARANLSVSAEYGGYDAWRYTRANALINAAVSSGGAEVADLLQIARDLTSPYIDPYPLPYTGTPAPYPELVGYVEARQTINRRSTVAGGVIQGVRPGEDPFLSTYYAMVGQPVVTPVVPLWVCAGPTPPAVDGLTTSALCDMAKSRMLACYDHPDNSQLLNTQLLVQLPDSEPGYLLTAESIDALVLPQIQDLLARWRAAEITPDQVAAAEAKQAASILALYQNYIPSAVDPGPGLTLLCAPNPMHDRTGICLEFPGGHLLDGLPAQWGVEIFDPQGRRWAKLLPQGPAAGGSGNGQSPVVWWDGRTQGGDAVPSGVYYCRPTWPARSRATPLIVIH